MKSTDFRQQTKNLRSTTTIAAADGASGRFETSWHYVDICYGETHMSLLVETGDEQEARREAEELCTRFDGQASALSVRKVVLQ